MTVAEARQILGLEPGESLIPAAAAMAREQILAAIKATTDPELAKRYRARLAEFDEALAVLSAPVPVIEFPPPLPPWASQLPQQLPQQPPQARRSRLGWWCLLLLTLGAAAAAIWWDRDQLRQSNERCAARIAMLDEHGRSLIENRRWQEAERSFAEIEAIAPNSELPKRGRAAIAAGITEEQNQWIGYACGQALSALDAGQLDEAQKLIDPVRGRFPQDHAAQQIQDRIAKSRVELIANMALDAARQQLAAKQWQEAIANCQRIIDSSPGHLEARTLIEEAKAGEAKDAADLAKALGLLERARARDQGRYDADALDWLREAAALAPARPEIRQQLERMSGYTRTLNVPGDFATPAEALAAARDHDRIVLAGQVWEGPLEVHAAIELVGQGPESTTIQCPAGAGSALVIAPAAKGVRIVGMTFRHSSFQAGENERFAAALVRGAEVTFTNCHFRDANGHGLMVIDGGHARASHCRMSGNGWNGAAAMGAASQLELRESVAVENFEHGIEVWNDAAAILVNNRCEANSRNGIHIDSGKVPATVEGNQLVGNREFGMVVDRAAGGKIIANKLRANLMGGLVVRAAAATVQVTQNQIVSNKGPGFILEQGLPIEPYASNELRDNTGPQMIPNAPLDRAPADPRPGNAKPQLGSEGK